MKTCPFCAEEIQEEAIRCKHCRSNLNSGSTAPNLASARLKRSRSNQQLMGVCAGIAETYNLDPTLVRILTVVVAVLTSAIPVIIAYIVLGIILPEGD